MSLEETANRLVCDIRKVLKGVKLPLPYKRGVLNTIINELKLEEKAAKAVTKKSAMGEIGQLKGDE